jgi:DNA-binding FadR family transcriptional regulator
VEEVLSFHEQLAAAMVERDSEAAARIMVEMLNHGAEHL